MPGGENSRDKVAVEQPRHWQFSMVKMVDVRLTVRRVTRYSVKSRHPEIPAPTCTCMNDEVASFPWGKQGTPQKKCGHWRLTAVARVNSEDKIEKWKPLRSIEI